jgi:hypothetical protein
MIAKRLMTRLAVLAVVTGCAGATLGGEAFTLDSITTVVPASNANGKVFGWTFEVPGTTSIIVTHVGVFDSDGMGLGSDHDVGIWYGTTQLWTSTVPAGGGTEYVDGYRYIELDPPLELPANPIPPSSAYAIAVLFPTGNQDDHLSVASVSFDDTGTVFPYSSGSGYSRWHSSSTLIRPTANVVLDQQGLNVNFRFEVPAPEITAIAIEPAALGSPTTVTADFTDEASGTHTATINWGDGTPDESGVVDEVEGTVTGAHTYAATGVYTVTVTVAGESGGEASGTAYAAVYDPEAVSFTAGGGSIADAGSPYGKAFFGFFIRQWGYWGPGGRLGFRWEDKCFQSTEIDYLIVSEDKSSAWFAGVGTVNGAGEYYFMAEVSDGPDGIDLIIFDQYETPGLVDLLGGRIEIRQWN